MPKPTVAQKPAAVATGEVMTEAEKSQLSGVDTESMVAQATEAAQSAHNTQLTQAVTKVEAAPAKAAVTPSPAPVQAVA